MPASIEPASIAPDDSDSAGRGPWPWVFLVVIGLFVLFVRVRLIQMPLERDEGEYAYAGQLMLEGIAPYKLVYNMKFPGTYAAYALIMGVFGQSVPAIRVGILIVNLAAIVLVFLMAKRLFARSAIAAPSAAAAYAMLTLQEHGLGMMGHATHFVILAALGGIWALMTGREVWRVLIAGLLLGLAVVMKQPGAVFVLLGGLQLLIGEIRARGRRWGRLIKRLFAYSAGVVLPFAVTCLLLDRAGAFDRFWFWTVRYAKAYGSEMTLAAAWPQLRGGIGNISSGVELIWMLAAAGLVLICLRRRATGAAALITGLLVTGVVAASAGFYFREHYFILVYPAVALLVAAALVELEQWIGHRTGAARFAPAGVLIVCAIAFVAVQGKFLFRETADEACRSMYGLNPFLEAPEIGRYIEEHSSPADSIAVLGSEPEVYFYARRRSATGFIYMYPLMEAQAFAGQMQRDMVAEIEKSRPTFVVVFKSLASWLARKDSDLYIQGWMKDYLATGFDVVGIVNPGPGTSSYRWDGAVEDASAGDDGIVIFRRKNPAHRR